MAENTDISLRNSVIYSVFVRNYSEEGTFKAVENDLDRIKNLGVDIIWLMPIHPIGKEKRKGSSGSPYAIMDYRSVNPDYGTMDDFKSLVKSIHERDMKCIIDVVYNHTSPDSVLSKNHPEWFYHKEDGTFGNKVGDWSDIIDLDYSNADLWDYQIDSLKMWAEIVDGFRCDVAPIIPINFWKKARDEVKKINENCIWLTESIEYDFINTMRRQGYSAYSDCEMYSVFDICYDYDIYNDLMEYFIGGGELKNYLNSLNRQESIYPDNYIKLHFLENHDRPRAHLMIKDRDALINWTAFLFFMKGSTLIFNGQEVGDKHYISLFDKDTVDWNLDDDKTDLSEIMRIMYRIKKKEIFKDGYFKCKEKEDGIIEAVIENRNRKIVGVFGVKDYKGLIIVDIEDGKYLNEINNKEYDIINGKLDFDGCPVVMEIDI